MKFLPLTACAAMILSGCSMFPTTAAPMTDAEATATLGRYHWNLSHATDKDGEYINALFARADKPLRLDFQDGRVHVANACNVLNGSVVIEGGKLEVKPMISTMMACMDPAVSALDRAIGSRLEQSDDFRIDTDATPPTLTLTTPDKDTLVFNGTPRQTDGRKN